MDNKIGGIGTVTDKALNKQMQQDLDKKTDLPDAEKAKEFDNLLSNADNKQAANNTQQVQVKLNTNTRESIGDKILNTFQNIKTDIDQRHTDINNKLNNSESISMKDMLQTQRAIANLTLTEDIIAKIVGKTTQNIDTLMKQQ